MTSILPGTRKSRHGFTLVEAIVVIAISGIVAGMIAVFLRYPVQDYVNSTARADLSDVADLTMRRMAREIRMALPNSVRLQGATGSTQYLEFLETSTGGRYLDASDGINSTGTYPGTYPVLDFVNSGNTSFYVTGTMPTGNQAITAGNYIAVYNLGTGYAPADAYNGPDLTATPYGNLATVTSVSGNIVTLKSNPFAAQPSASKMESPSFHFQVVTTPVTYVCTPGTNGAGSVVRYWGYTIQETQPAPPSGGSHAVLANRVTNCGFTYNVLANQQVGLVELSLTMQVPSSSSGTVTLTQQVHVDNSP